MAKKDRDTRIDIERTEERSEDSLRVKNDACNDEKPNDKTEVKNAHAVGLGAIGRHDEKLDKDDTGFSSY